MLGYNAIFFLKSVTQFLQCNWVCSKKEFRINTQIKHICRTNTATELFMIKPSYKHCLLEALWHRNTTSQEVKNWEKFSCYNINVNLHATWAAHRILCCHQVEGLSCPTTSFSYTDTNRLWHSKPSTAFTIVLDESNTGSS